MNESNVKGKIHVEPISDFETHGKGSQSVSNEEKKRFLRGGEFISEPRGINLLDGQKQIKVWRTYQGVSEDTAVIIQLSDADYYDYLTGHVLNSIKMLFNEMRIKLGKNITDFEKPDKKSDQKYTVDKQISEDYISRYKIENCPKYNNKKLFNIFNKIINEIIFPTRTKLAHHEAYIDNDNDESYYEGADALLKSIENLKRDLEIVRRCSGYIRSFMSGYDSREQFNNKENSPYKDYESYLADYENDLFMLAKKIYGLSGQKIGDSYFQKIKTDDTIWYKDSEK